jgi:hypothetical protein
MEHFTIRRNGKNNIKDSLKFKAGLIMDRQRAKLLVGLDKFCYLAEHSTLAGFEHRLNS